MYIKNLKRQHLPLAIKFNHQFDITKILSDFKNFGFDDFNKYDGLKYTKAFSNGLYCRKYLLQNFLNEQELNSSQKELVPQGGEAYKLLCMTDFSEKKAQIQPDTTTVYGFNSAESSRKRFEREKNEENPFYIPEADERNYNAPNEHLKGQFKNIFESIRGEVCRTRLAVLMPGQEIKIHVDSNTNYAIRLHVPIETSAGVVFGVQGKKTRYEFHMPADGHMWFLNTAFPHYVKNLSDKPRVHLIFSVIGQEQLNQPWKLALFDNTLKNINDENFISNKQELSR